jgi:sporulation protein YlmC with PRC-barrel domain
LVHVAVPAVGELERASDVLGADVTSVIGKGGYNMARLTPALAAFALAATVAGAQAQQSAQGQAGPPAQILSSVPANSMTITNWYKQNVYDPSDKKIGEVMDVLVDREGKAEALVVGVGGFLGAGEKDVLVPFNAVHGTNKDNKWYLVMNTTKNALKNAKGFKYDRTKTTWIPEEASTTTGGGGNANTPRTNPNR